MAVAVPPVWCTVTACGCIVAPPLVRVAQPGHQFLPPAEVEAGRLVIMDVVGLPLIKTWHVVRRTDKRLLPSAEAMYRFWVEHGGEYLPKISGHAD